MFRTMTRSPAACR